MSAIYIKQKNAYNYMINSTSRRKRKMQELKEITQLYLRKESTDIGTEEKIHV